MKTLFLGLGLTGCLLALPAQAVTCDFTGFQGKAFEFAQLSAWDRYQNRQAKHRSQVYPRWFSDPHGKAPLDFTTYYGRAGKLIDHRFLRQAVPNPDRPGTTQPVRYYKALADNCQTVYVQVRETDPQLQRYFNLDDHKLDGRVPWEWEESHFNVQWTDTYQKLLRWQGKRLTTVPVTHGGELPAYSQDYRQRTTLAPFTALTLEGIEGQAFDDHGRHRAPYTLRVRTSAGSTLMIPYDPEYLVQGNPLKDAKIRPRYRTAIQSGRIEFGMNKAEIRLAWGAPHLERHHPAFEQPGGSVYIQEDLHPYGGDYLPGGRVFPVDDRKPVADQVVWYYPERLEAGQFLVFDLNGELHPEQQTWRIFPNRVQPVSVTD